MGNFMTNKETFVVQASLSASYDEYFHERLGRVRSDIEIILSNVRLNDYLLLDISGNEVDYVKIATQVKKDQKELDSFNIYLKKNGHEACVKFFNNEGGLNLTITPLNTIVTKKLATDDVEEEALDLAFYVNILIDLSEGFMIRELDAHIVENQE